MEHDEDELELLIDNDYELYKQKILIFQNLWKKMKSGVFDKTKAPKAFSYLTEKAAKKYNRLYPDDYKFTIQTRRKADMDFTQEFLNAVKNKEYDFMQEGTVYSGKF